MPLSPPPTSLYVAAIANSSVHLPRIRPSSVGIPCNPQNARSRSYNVVLSSRDSVRLLGVGSRFPVFSYSYPRRPKQPLVKLSKRGQLLYSRQPSRRPQGRLASFSRIIYRSGRADSLLLERLSVLELNRFICLNGLIRRIYLYLTTPSTLIKLTVLLQIAEGGYIANIARRITSLLVAIDKFRAERYI